VRNDPKKAAKLALKALTPLNPPVVGNRLEQIRLQIPEMALRLQTDGVNVSSLTEDQWRSILVAQGIDEEDATEVLEDIASWGVTDEV